MENEFPDERPRCACGKVSFDKKGARTSRNSLLKAGTAKYLRIYQCPLSNKWHLTKQRPRS